jgi:hypothetical protein
MFCYTCISPFEFPLVKYNLMFSSRKGVSLCRDISFHYSFFSFHSLNFRYDGYNISCSRLNSTPSPLNISYLPWLVICYTTQNGLLYRKVKLSSFCRIVQCRPQPCISMKANCNQSHDIALANRFCSTLPSYGVQVNETDAHGTSHNKNSIHGNSRSSNTCCHLCNF